MITKKKRSGKARNETWIGRSLAFGLLVACASPYAFAQSVSVQTFDGPGLVQMIDGSDPGDQVTVQIKAPELWCEGYDFGFMDGQTFHSLMTGDSSGSATFASGALVDFTLERRGDEGSYQYYRLSDIEGYAIQRYFRPFKPSHSQSPAVTADYYRKLTLFWDPDQDHDRDVKVVLSAESRFDGMQRASLQPVPVPGSVWLLGSGLIVLAMLRYRGATVRSRRFDSVRP